MNKKELSEFKKELKKYLRKNTESKEKARDALVKIGTHNKNGTLRKVYQGL